jgi:hypothetical protein
VRYGILLFALLLGAETAIRGQTDPRLEQALPQIARQASNFWHSAPSYVARETLKQKAIVPSRRKLRIGKSALEPRTPSFKDREIVSYYGFSSYQAAPESLHEFRCVVTIDEKTVAEAQAAHSRLLSILESSDDGRKRSLSEEFQKDGLGSSAIDFGQLILLFTRSRLDQYSFELRSSGMVGVEQALTIEFRQVAGNESLHISEAGKKVRRPLEGELVVREADFHPLRVTLRSEHWDGDTNIRDNATVEYAPLGTNTNVMLPASVAFRRYFNDELYLENIAQYSDWQPVSAN